MRKFHFTKGYSIIELLVYIALFVTISLVVMQSLLFILKTYATARAYRTLQQNGELVMERITREVRQASSVSPAASVFASSPGTLALSGEEADTTPYTASIGVSNGVVEFTKTGVTGQLSSNEVVVNELIFWHIDTLTEDAIRVQLVLSTTRQPFVSSTFNTTVVLRE